MSLFDSVHTERHAPLDGTLPAAPGAGGYDRSVESPDRLVLRGNAAMVIEHCVWNQYSSIELSGGARLIIRDAHLRLLADGPDGLRLSAGGDSQVVVENSTIEVNQNFVNWNFTDRAELRLRNVVDLGYQIWHGFSDSAAAVVEGARFSGTQSGEVGFVIRDSPGTYIEIVLPIGAELDTPLPTALGSFELSPDTSRGIRSSLLIENSDMQRWGISVNPGSRVSVRDCSALTVTPVLGGPSACWRGRTIRLEGLGTEALTSRQIDIPELDLSIELSRVTPLRWSPIVGPGNLVLLTDCQIADNAFSWGNRDCPAAAVMRGCDVTFLNVRRGQHVNLVASDCLVGSVRAESGSINLRDCRLSGSATAKYEGQVRLRGVHREEGEPLSPSQLTASEGGQITAD